MSGVTFQGAIRGRTVFAGNSISDSANVTIHLPSDRLDTPPHPSSSIIPFRRDPNFVPRGRILDRLHELCSKPAGRAALVGLGGVGKSQLAIEFAHQIKAANTTSEAQAWVFWVHASTASRIEQAFQDIAEAIKVPNRTQPGAHVMQLVYSTLSKETWGRWYMILDGCDNYDVLFGVRGSAEHERPAATYLPQSENGSILLTTRNRDIAYRLTGETRAIVPVGPMLEQEAIRLLESRLGPSSNAEIASDLVKALDLIPLAISQAAAHIQARQPLTSMEKYLADFRASESQRVRLLNYDAGDLRRDGGASNAVLTTWKLSFEYIRWKWPSAANLLSLMSFFNPQGIPKWLLEHYEMEKSGRRADTPEKRDAEPQGRDEKRHTGHLRSFLGRFHGKRIWSKHSDPTTNAISTPPETIEYTDEERRGHTDGINDNFDDDISILRDYFFVTVTEAEDIFGMHRLVQLSTRKWLEDNGLHNDFKLQYVTLLKKWFPVGSFDNWRTCEELYPHVQGIMEHLSESETGQEAWSVPLAYLLYNGGYYCIQKGLHDTAVTMLETALIIFKENLGQNAQDTLNCTTLVAHVWLDKGRATEAENLLREAIEIQKNLPEPNYLGIISSGTQLAAIYSHQDRYDEAERLLAQVLEIDDNLQRMDNQGKLNVMASLAMVYSRQGRYDEAEQLYLLVLNGWKEIRGTDYPDTLTVMNNLALNYSRQGRYDMAEELKLKVLERRASLLGTEHTQTLGVMRNLADMYAKQGRHEEAEELLKQTLEIQKNLPETERSWKFKTAQLLALIYQEQGRSKEALEMIQECAGPLQACGVDGPRAVKALPH